jgi:hypothetical protein
MPDLDVEELARSLVKATSNLERHITTEAQKRANKLAVEYAKAADERIKQNAADMQRLQDLVAELRRQMRPLVCTSVAYQALGKHLEDVAHSAKQCGTDVPLDALWDAMSAARAAGHAEYERQKKEKTDARQEQSR